MDANIAKAIPAFYDASVSSGLWTATLDSVVKSVPGAVGSLVIVVENCLDDSAKWDFQRASSLFVKDKPEGAKYVEENFFEYEKEAWKYISQQNPQDILSDTDFWTEPGLDDRPDYIFSIEEMGLRRKVGARLNGNKCWFDTISVQLHKDHIAVPSSARDALRLLLPHAAKAVELTRTFGLLEARYQAVLAALNQVEIGLCIVLPSGEVMVANHEAERILSCGDAIRRNPNSLLKCRATDRDAELQFAIQRAAATAGGEIGSAESLLVMERASSQHPLLVETTPLRDPRGELERNLCATLVTLIDAGNPRPFDVMRLAMAYKLSRAETAVCKLMVEGWTYANIAEERNVGPETVKTQASSVYFKTNTSKRSELIRLVLRASPPVK